MTIQEKRAIKRKSEIMAEFITAGDQGPGPADPGTYFLPETGYQIIETPESMDIDYLF